MFNLKFLQLMSAVKKTERLYGQHILDLRIHDLDNSNSRVIKRIFKAAVAAW